MAAPMHRLGAAVYANDPQAIAAALRDGASLSATLPDCREGYTALHCAAYDGKTAAARALVAAGAPLDAITKVRGRGLRAAADGPAERWFHAPPPRCILGP